MDIRDLQYFIAVVEAGSISSAAKKLHISQPPLSQQIKLLESELGVSLMERGPRKIVLTDAGKALYNRALSIVEFTSATLLELSNYRYGAQGTLRIGTPSSCGSVLAEFIKNNFSKEYPDVTYQIFEKNTYELIKLLENNIIEIALLRTPFSNDTSFNTFVMSEESIVAVATEAFFDRGEEIIGFEQLVDCPLIIYRRWEPLFSECFKKHGLTPTYYCINDDARTSLFWARRGLGVALVPSSISRYFSDERMILKKIQGDFMQTEICLVWKAFRHLSPSSENFINSARAWQR